MAGMAVVAHCPDAEHDCSAKRGFVINLPSLLEGRGNN